MQKGFIMSLVSRRIYNKIHR